MHIAVLFYGRLTKCAEHYDNIIDSIGKEHTIDFFLSSDNSPSSQLDLFIEIYKPVSYINDKVHYSCNLGNYPGKRAETNIHNMTCHFINKGRVYSLLEEHVNKTGIIYDVVLSIRIDLVFKTKFNFVDIQDDIIYIPNCNDFIDRAINDQVAYGKMNIMKKYNSISSNMVNILDKGLSIPHPESLTYANLLFHNVIIKRFKLDYFIER